MKHMTPISRTSALPLSAEGGLYDTKTIGCKEMPINRLLFNIECLKSGSTCID